MNVSIVAGKPSVATGEQGIQWSPISSPVRLQFSGTSYLDVRSALIEAFGQFPVRLTNDHIPVLNGMCAAAGAGKQPYQQLLTALKQFGNLELTTV